MSKRFLVAVALSGLSIGALADDKFPFEAQTQVVDLKDGQVLYVFKDGKMAVADQRGRSAAVKPGTTVETRNGEKILVSSNEVYRLHLGASDPG